MAKALVMGIEQAYIENGIPKLQVGLIYSGVDVPGSLQRKSIIVDASTVVNVADLGVLIAAAARSTATASGYTVAASNVFLPSYVGA